MEGNKPRTERQNADVWIRMTIEPSPEVQLLGLTLEGPEWRLPTRVIPEWEWVIVERGRVQFHVEETVHTLLPGDALLLEPFVRHGIIGMGEEGCRFYYIHFQPVGIPERTTPSKETERLESIRMSLRSQLAENPFYMLPKLRMTDIAIPMRFSLGQQADAVFMLFERALAERNHYGVDSQLLICLLSAQILTLGARAASAGAGHALSEAGAMDRTLQDALARMHTEPGSALSIRALADELGVSQQYLTRLFSDRLGMPPLQYINRLRLEQAKSMMRRTRMNIQEIAWSCGFANPYYFARLFRRVEGETPSHYRNRLNIRRNC